MDVNIKRRPPEEIDNVTQVVINLGVKQHESPNISKNATRYVLVPMSMLMSAMCYVMKIRKAKCTFYATHHAAVLCKVLCY